MVTEMMLIDTVTLRIDPPLPCAVVANGETCNHPAHVAHAYRTSGPKPGHWLIMPVCEECTETGAALYTAAGSHGR
jgi:hypothetical protein